MPLHPSVARIASVARALGPLSTEVVFIGGAIAPLLQTDPVLPRIRPTDDVDAIVASTHYTSYNAIEARLRALGFKTEMAEQKHAHRWRAPDGTFFDLVPAGEHLGGTGGVWDQFALETALTTEIEPGITIRHASAAGFLALKWAAFWDRGLTDSFRSEDLEDILALLVSRDWIVSDVANAPQEVKEQVRKGLRWLTNSQDYHDLLAGYLGAASNYSRVTEMLRKRLAQILAD